LLVFNNAFHKLMAFIMTLRIIACSRLPDK
jgi:hypothetical protein